MRKTFVSMGFALTAASSLALTPGDYARCLEVALSPTSAPASEVTDFPALLRLSTDIRGFSYADFRQPDYSDLAIVDGDGAELAYEIDTWNQSGESLVWVRIPRLTKDLRLTVYFGSDKATPQAPAEVWRDYAAVWHCSDASGDLTDATGNGHSAATAGHATDQMVACADGAVGVSRAGQNNCTYYAGRGYIGGHVVPSGWAAALAGSPAFTVSGWFKAKYVVGWMRLLSCKSVVDSAAGWELEFEDDPRKVFFRTQGESGFLAECPNVAGADWVNLTLVVDGTRAACYTNGYLSAAVDSIPAVQWPQNEGLGLGVNADCSEAGFYGWIDELRLKSGALSAAEVAAAYRTVADRSFFSYATVRAVDELPVDVSGFAKSVSFTVGATAPTVDAPQVVLVRLSSAIQGFDYADFTDTTGADMVFVDDEGRELKHEIDTWNQSGESLVWVRLNACRPGDVFRLCYGKSGHESAATADTWKDYVGVWHFREDGGTAYDSGANAYHGTPMGARAEYNVGVEGVVGKARQNGGNGDPAEGCRAGLSLTDTTALALGSQFTVSGFFYVEAGGGWYRFVSRRSGAGGWGQELTWNDVTRLNVYGAGDGEAVTIPSPERQWVYLTICYDDKTCAVYANGEFIAEAKLGSAPTDNGAAIAFGNTAEINDWSLYGNYDEIRIARGIPSAAAIATDYATVMRPDFLAAGPAQQTDPAPIACSAPVVRRAASGGLEGVFTLKSGGGTFAAAYDGGVVQPLPDVTSEPGEKTFPVSALPANESSRCTVVGTSVAGAEYRFATEPFYTGSLAVEKVEDADEMHTAAGVFRISRTDAPAATRHALKVNYAFSGTAVAGVNYAGAATGTAEIPAGAAFVDVTVRPLVDAASDGDKTLTVTLTPGAYLPGASDTAEMTIHKLPPPTKRSFSRRLDLTIPAGFLAEGEVLRNFPVLVRLSPAIAGFDYADFRTEDGSDMIFADRAFVAVPHSVDEWHADGTSFVWVCVPELRRDTQLRLFYGSADDIAGADAGRPWKNYVGVWHFNENAHSVPARDSSGNGLDAVPGATHYLSGSKDYEGGGQVGRARWNQPAVHTDFGRNWYEVPNYDSQAVGNVFLFSGWFKGGDKISGCPRLVSRKTYYDTISGWEVELGGSYTSLNARGNSAASVAATTVPDLSASWTHLAFQYTRNGERGNDLTVYVNGEAVAAATVGLGMDNGLPLVFGCDVDHNEASFFGAFDELRLRRGNAGAAWVKAEYLTASDPAFVVYGAVGPASPGVMLIVR